MQDFTKLPKIENNNTALPDKEEKWLTKDRFWNFVFWFGMSFGFGLSFKIAQNGKNTNTFSYWSSVLFWLTLIGVPLMLKIFNGTKFIKVFTFSNSEGKILTEEQRPYLFLYALFVGVPLVFIVSETFLDKNFNNFILNFIFFVVLLAPINLYFIFKNCPISILFNPKFWTVDGHPNIALLKKVKKNISED